MFQNTDYQYYTLMGEGFNPFYSSQWNKELIQPPLVKEIQDEIDYLELKKQEMASFSRLSNVASEKGIYIIMNL